MYGKMKDSRVNDLVVQEEALLKMMLLNQHLEREYQNFGVFLNIRKDRNGVYSSVLPLLQ